MLYIKIPARFVRPDNPNVERHKQAVLEQLRTTWTLAGFAFAQSDLDTVTFTEETEGEVQS